MPIKRILEVVNTENKSNKNNINLHELAESNENYYHQDDFIHLAFETKNTIDNLARSNYINVGNEGFKRNIPQGSKGIILGISENNSYLLHFTDNTILELGKDEVINSLRFGDFVPTDWVENVLEGYPKAYRRLGKDK